MYNLFFFKENIFVNLSLSLCNFLLFLYVFFYLYDFCFVVVFCFDLFSHFTIFTILKNTKIQIL